MDLTAKSRTNGADVRGAGSAPPLDDVDMKIINGLQEGFPLCPRPFAVLATHFCIEEQELIARIAAMLSDGILTRFGPLFQVERAGGAYCLAAMAVPQEAWDDVVLKVNRHSEVAHNYAREHTLNMWFVLATERPEFVDQCIARIQEETGLPVFAFPKQKEYFLNMQLEY